MFTIHGTIEKVLSLPIMYALSLTVKKLRPMLKVLIDRGTNSWAGEQIDRVITIGTRLVVGPKLSYTPYNLRT